MNGIKVTNTKLFQIWKEDHTVANLLREKLLDDDKVSKSSTASCGLAAFRQNFPNFGGLVLGCIDADVYK